MDDINMKINFSFTEYGFRIARGYWKQLLKTALKSAGDQL